MSGATAGRAARPLVLVMRRGLVTMPDHVQALRDCNIAIHLLTVDSEPWADDPRFTSVTCLPRDAPADEMTSAAVALARERSAAAVITFIEPDIVIAESANAHLHPEWARPEAATVCRNKEYQRRFLRDHDLPTVEFEPVTGRAEDVVASLPFPLVVKPTRAAASDLVELVHDETALRRALSAVEEMVGSGRNFYYAGEDEPWAVLETYLPGEEITIDGVVLDGVFHLGGIHNKLRSDGPRFEEDLYTLPFLWPELEGPLSAVCQRLAEALELRHAMLNVEMRQDAAGDFAVVEFSIRVSGGHVYRHVRDVYGVDLVRLYARVACGEEVEEVLASETPRLPPRMAVSAKVVYGRGEVRRNSVGAAAFSPYTRVYYPCAAPGTRVVAGDGGFDFVGLLSVWAPLEGHRHPDHIHRIAHELAGQLDYEVT